MEVEKNQQMSTMQKTLTFLDFTLSLYPYKVGRTGGIVFMAEE